MSTSKMPSYLYTSFLALIALAKLETCSVYSQRNDWLVDASAGYPSKLEEDVCWEDGLCGMELSNGLLARRFVSNPGFGTVDFLLTDAFNQSHSMLRAIESEGSFTANGRRYRVGDLDSKSGDTFRAYLNRTDISTSMRRVLPSAEEGVFRYLSHSISRMLPIPFNWIPGSRHSKPDAKWPPLGLQLMIKMEADDPIDTFAASPKPPFHLILNFVLYDGMPAMSKWLTIIMRPDDGQTNVMIDDIVVEQIASYPPYGAYLTHGSSHPYSFYNGAPRASTSPPPPQLLAFTDQAHGAACRWIDDFFTSNDTEASGLAHDMGAVEPLLVCNYTKGPSVQLSSESEQSSSFDTFKTLLLATDSIEPDRHSLMKHRLQQTLLPHTTENPIFFHAVLDPNSTFSSFKDLVQQLADAGFEMLIFSFGSGFQLETNETRYMEEIRQRVLYAKRFGIEVGGYDLICLDRGHDSYGGNVGDEYAAIDPLTGNMTIHACLASGWYDKLHQYILQFLDYTGITMLELDGPYGGETCASNDHVHHDGVEDSIYHQNRLQGALFGELQNRGIYVNQPDTYFFQGGSRTGMGYDENQYSLPRWHQLTVSRMGLYDDLYRYLPTQGWMFVPLSETYHGGGDPATFVDDPDAFEWALAQYLGAGTAACYRGPFLYNSTSPHGSQIRTIAKKWIGFYKRHRAILIQPVVHLRRATLQGWDGWLHVDPFGDVEVGLAMIFNPTDRWLRDEPVRIPLYHTSLKDMVRIRVNEGAAQDFVLSSFRRDQAIIVKVNMPPRSIHHVILERNEKVHAGVAFLRQ